MKLDTFTSCILTQAELASASLPLPPVLDPGITNRLPLEVPSRVRAATGERLYVIFPVAGASAAGSAGRLPCPAVILRDLPTGYAHRDDSVMQHVGVAVSDGCMQRRAGMSGRPGTDSR